MIHTRHFYKDYLEIEQTKKTDLLFVLLLTNHVTFFMREPSFINKAVDSAQINLC